MANAYASDEALLRDYHKLSAEYQKKTGRYIKDLLKLQLAETNLRAKINAFENPAGENADTPAAPIQCSFCGKEQDAVAQIIAGPYVYICNECVELCMEILNEMQEECRENESAKGKEE